jgi:hypothetical protein
MMPPKEKVMVPAYSYGLEGGVSGVVEQGFDAVGAGCEWLAYVSGR